MAKNFKAAKSDDKKFGRRNDKFSANRKRNPSNRGKVAERKDVRDNVTLSRMSSESPRVSTSPTIVFPEDSASIHAFGSYTTTPGQENWIEEFNETMTNGTSDHPIIQKAFNAASKRTCNAMCIDVLPLFGPTDQINRSNLANPITLAGLNLKQFIDTSFGTKTDYDPQDLMLYLMGVAAVFPIIAEIKRDLRLTYTVMHDQFPQYVPKGLFALLEIADGSHRWEQGEGYLYTAEHLRSYIDKLNQWIFTFNRLPIPPELAALGYNDDLFDAIWLDSEDTQTAQLYVFRNSDYWEYTESAHPYPSLCHWPMGVRSIDDKITILGRMVEKLTALRTSSNAMLQNLFNAYGSKDTIQLAALDFDSLQPLPFVYDEHILMMIENLVICNFDNVDISHFVADADKQSVIGHVTMYEMTNGGAEACLNVPLQFHKPWDSITHDDIGWALRLHPMFNLQKKDKVYSNRFLEGSDWDSYYADACMGFGIATLVKIGSFKNDGTMQWTNCRYGDGYTTWSFIQARDFHAAPIYRYCSYSAADNIMRSCQYYANRDVEVTYRIADIVMYWIYLTNTLWAANVNRNAPGTRYKGRPDTV